MSSTFFKTSGIAIVSSVYILIVLIMYFVKGKNSKITGKYFYTILVLSFLSNILYIVFGVFCDANKLDIASIIGRIQIFITLEWVLLTIHYLAVAFKTEEENIEYYKKSGTGILISIIAVNILNLICCIFLNLDVSRISDSSPYLMEGYLDLYYKVWGLIMLLCATIFLIKYRKRSNFHTTFLYIFCIIVLILAYAIVYLFGVSMSNIPFLVAMVMIFLYFTLESQDASLLNEFNVSTKKAEESNKLKSEFIMNMSHQLRTPMNTILGYSDFIASNENLDEVSAKEDAENIKFASEKLYNLICAILDISKLEGNKEVVHSENYNLENIIYDVSSNINSKLKENIVFTINADEICPNDLVGDAYKLCKILNIIIMNAVNHTEYGEVSLNVSCIQIDSLNYEFTFLVKNSGHSMLHDEFNRNFEDLIKLSNDNNSEISANVLNLIVAKGLLELIGGSVEFINETGKGTQYIIKLKQKLYGQTRLGNLREKIQTKHSLSHNILSLLGKKVLIIDENKVNVNIIERLLSQYNIGIETSLNPKDSIELVGRNNYDFIIVNHNMSDMSGEEVVSKLNSTGNRVPVIIGVITKANDEIKDVYDYVLNSPIEFKELNKIINSIFNGGDL